MTFPEYVRRFERYHDAKGQFARRALTDRNFPESGEFIDYERYLKSTFASKRTLQGLDAAWRSYAAKTFRRVHAGAE